MELASDLDAIRGHIPADDVPVCHAGRQPPACQAAAIPVGGRGAAVGHPVLTMAEGTLAPGIKVASDRVYGTPGGLRPVTPGRGARVLSPGAASTAGAAPKPPSGAAGSISGWPRRQVLFGHRQARLPHSESAAARAAPGDRGQGRDVRANPNTSPAFARVSVDEVIPARADSPEKETPCQTPANSRPSSASTWRLPAKSTRRRTAPCWTQLPAPSFPRGPYPAADRGRVRDHPGQASERPAPPVGAA